MTSVHRLRAGLVICLLAFVTSVPVAAVAQSAEHTKNLRVSPLGLIIGAISATLDFTVAHSITVGPTVSYLNVDISDLKLKATSFGVRGNYYFDRPAITEGWYLGPYLQYSTVDLDAKIGTTRAEGSGSGLGGGALIGYQWIWESFNINLGGGFAVSSVGNIRVTNEAGVVEERNSTLGAGLGLEFTLGWAF